MKFSSILLSGLAGLASLAVADKFDEDAVTADAEANTSNLNVKLSASFPDSEIFGVKLVNGHSTQAIVSLDNQEQRTISLQIVGGSLWTPDYGDAEGAEPSRIVRNLTTQVYRASVPAGEKETFQYNFALEMHPADLELRLIGILSTDENAFFTKEVYRGAVSVVEAPTSFFDPKIIFLYFILGATFAGIAYFIYSTWITTLFPQQKRRSGPANAVKPVTPAPAKTAPSPGDVAAAAQASGSKVYDESWIPQQHLKQSGAKRVRSGTPSGVKTKKAV